MPKISEIADASGYDNKTVIQKAKELNFDVKTASNILSDEDAGILYDYITTGKKPDNFEEPKPKKAKKTEKVEKTEKPAKEEKKAPAKKTSTKSVAKKSEDKEEKPKKAKKIEKPQNEDKEEKIEKPQEKPSQDPINQVKEPATLQQESLASGIVKRRGLVIVKKKKEEISPKPPKTSEILPQNIESMFGSGDLSKKKKKEKKHEFAVKKENSAKIDLLGDFGSDIVIDDEDVVVLPDLTVKPIEIERPQTTKKPMNVYKTAQNTTFNLEGGIQRHARKKHKKVSKTQNDDIVSSVEIPSEIRLYEFADKIKNPQARL